MDMNEEGESFQVFDKVDVMAIRDFISYVDTLYLHDITRFLDGSVFRDTASQK